jgi:hypothetical protein
LFYASLTLREVHRLGVLRKIFGSKTEDVKGDWRKLHEELRNIYPSPNIIHVFRSGRMIWVGHVACVEKTCIWGSGGETR